MQEKGNNLNTETSTIDDNLQIPTNIVSIPKPNVQFIFSFHNHLLSSNIQYFFIQNNFFKGSSSTVAVTHFFESNNCLML